MQKKHKILESDKTCCGMCHFDFVCYIFCLAYNSVYIVVLMYILAICKSYKNKLILAR